MDVTSTSGDSAPRKIQIVLPITVREFADAAGIKPFKVVADLMELGVFAALNQSMLEEPIILVGAKNGVAVEIIKPERN